MAIDKKLQIFDDEGNPVDYDILASDVKFNDGKDLPTKLAEMDEEIGEGGYTPPQDGIPKTDLEPSVQQTLDNVANKVDKVLGKGLSTNDYTTEDKTKLGNLPTNPVQSISVNGGTAQTPTNGNVNIQVQGGGLTKEDISVETQGDGTFTIHVGNNDYTINLNHTHEGMAKLHKFVADNPPASMTDDTIYVQVDDVTTPQEIQSLWLFGLEFAGGGSAPGTPFLSSPGANVNMGDVENGSVTKTIRVKGRYLTQNLSAILTGIGYTFATTQPTGVTRNSDTSLTITADAAKAGVDISVVYTGTALNATATLSIISSSPDSIDVESTLVANKIPYVFNGLDFWLDGEDLANGHWIDRVKGIDFTMNNVATRPNGGVYFNGTDAYGKYGSTLGYTPTGCTIEIVADFNFNASMLLFMQNADNLLVFGSGVRNNEDSTRILFSSGPDIPKLCESTSFADGLGVYSAGGSNFYYKKTKLTLATEGYYGKRSEVGTFIGSRTSSENLFTGTIYQIRIYNRILTEAEILANQQIDIERYNIS